jgi:hypothetical protein
VPPHDRLSLPQPPSGPRIRAGAASRRRADHEPSPLGSHDAWVTDHLSIEPSDMGVVTRFGDAVLPPSVPSASSTPATWSAPGSGSTAGSGSGRRRRATTFGVPIAATACSRATGQAFFATAVAAGAEVLHEPRLWPEHHETHCGAFVSDPDGGSVEAVPHAAQ